MGTDPAMTIAADDSVDPVEPAPADAGSPDAGPDPLGADTDSDDEDDSTDAMGIDDDDPIDATLVGKPVDADDDRS